MKAIERAALALLAIGAWQVIATPQLLSLLEDRKAGRAAPPSPPEVRAKLALLPASDSPPPALVALEAALDTDARLASAETSWNLLVAQALTEPERERAEQIGDMDAPRTPPPLEAPEADGDVVSLARALLDNYGYVEVDVPTPATQDRWPGIDRRGRARGIKALANERSLEPETAHVILAATLAFLDAQLAKAENSTKIEHLLPVVLGEPPAGS